MNVSSSQVASVLQRAVQSVLTRGLSDPRVRGLISVTKVELSADRSQAVISVSVLPEEHVELTMHGLQHAASHIRYQVSRDIKLRRTPRLIFKLDKSLKKQAEVMAAIARTRSPGDTGASEQETNTPRAEVPES